MNRIIGWTAAALVFSGALPLDADMSPKGETFYVAPSPSGNDGNDCRTPSAPCATFQRPVDLCSTGGICAILPAPGSYSISTNVYYYKVIMLAGPTDAKGNCINRDAIIIQNEIGDPDDKRALFRVQDHAILTLNCMTLAGHAENSIGFVSRQFAIGDVDNVNFVDFGSGTVNAANETSKITVFSPGVFGKPSRFVAASDLSQVTINGDVVIGKDSDFQIAFLSSMYGSIVNFEPKSVSGEQSVSGASYQCVDAIIKKSAILPGKDTPYPGNDNCHVR